MRQLRPTPKLFLSLTFSLGLLLTPGWAANKKGEQAKPAAKAPTGRKQIDAAEERKGKKAAPVATALTSKLPANKANISKQNALAVKSQSDKAVKGKLQEGKRCAKCPIEAAKTLLVSAKGKLVQVVNLKSGNVQLATNKKGATKTALEPTSKQARAELKPLSSRLVQASFASAATEEPRGKFGKANAKSSRSKKEEEEVQATATTSARVRDTAKPKAIDFDKALATRESTRTLSAEPEGDKSEKDDQKHHRRPREVSEKENTPAYEIAYPDQIEVVEYGSTSPKVQSLLTLPTERPLTPFGAVVTRNGSTPSKRNDLTMAQQRVLEIQYQLANRGFYNAEPTGVYDEATVQAMWEFQKNYGLPATGYPTAHALKRLGLAN